MNVPPIPDLENAAKKLVWNAKKQDTLKQLTPRLIRQEVEKQFSLEQGILDASEYKDAIKAATKAAMNEEPPASEEEVVMKKSKGKPKSKAQPAGKNKRKLDESVKVDEEEEDDAVPSPKKGKGTAKATVKDEEHDDEVEVYEEGGSSAKKKRKLSKPRLTKIESKNEEIGDDAEATPKKKQKLSKPQAKKTTPEDEPSAPSLPSKGKEKPKPKDTKQYKSLEHVPTSDMEQDDSDPVIIAGQASKPTEPAKAAKKSPSRSKSGASSNPKSDTSPQKKETSMSISSKPLSKTALVKADESGEKSESELSVLIDEQPKKRKSSAGEKKAPKPKEKKPTKSSTVLSKDEETIKRLKSLVVACGTRKVWSKVFQDLDTPQQQIKKLKEILTELGMTGRFSLEQAKAIKEKRELAKELEDVQEFERTIVARSSRSRANIPNKNLKEDSEDEEEEDENDSEDDVGVPKRRATNARKSILAFLEDQSDDE